ncbi:MAG: hypothetical protein RQM92_01150 [Candidatus Syntrophopropionicum ammoniitolerans]
MQGVIESRDELILDHKTRIKLHHYLAIAFIAGGVLGFIPYFLPHMVGSEDSLKSMLFTSGLFFILGLTILACQYIKSQKTRSILIITITLLSIPIVTLKFLEYSSITVWVFPIIIMIVSLVFSTRTLLILVTAVAVVTQILVWLYAPREAIQMDQYDYIMRIGILMIAFWVGWNVNKIYIKRLKENIYQINFQKLVSEISTDFVSVNQVNIDEKIKNMLNKTGRFFHADRTYIFMIDHQDSTMTYTHEWCNEGISPEVEPFKMYPWIHFPGGWRN